MLTIYYKIIQD